MTDDEENRFITKQILQSIEMLVVQETTFGFEEKEVVEQLMKGLEV